MHVCGPVLLGQLQAELGTQRQVKVDACRKQGTAAPGGSGAASASRAMICSQRDVSLLDVSIKTEPDIWHWVTLTTATMCLVVNPMYTCAKASSSFCNIDFVAGLTGWHRGGVDDGETMLDGHPSVHISKSKLRLLHVHRWQHSISMDGQPQSLPATNLHLQPGLHLQQWQRQWLLPAAILGCCRDRHRCLQGLALKRRLWHEHWLGAWHTHNAHAGGWH